MVIQRFILNLPAKSLPPHHLKIAFQNINGWNEDKKPALTQYFTQLNPDIILFAHTNIHANTAPLKLHPYTVYMHNTDTQYSGVAILVKPNIKHCLVNHQFRGDTIAITVETSLGPINIATNYSPPRRQYIPIADINWLSRHRTPTYILADLNAHHRTFDTSTNDYGIVLYNEWLRHGNLRRIGPPTGTFRTPRGALTMPDIVLSNRHCYHFSHCSNLPFNVSDHAPLCLEISARAIKIPSPEFELNAKANWNRFENILKEKVTPINLNLRNNQENDNYIQTFTEIVHAAKKEAIPRSTFKYSTKLTTSRKFKRLQKVLNFIHTLIELNQNNPMHVQNLNKNKKTTIDRLKEEAKRIQSKNWHEFLEKLNRDRKLDPKQFWQTVKPILSKTSRKGFQITDTGDNTGRILTDPVEIERSLRTEWENHFLEPPEDRIDPIALEQNREFHLANPDLETPHEIIDISRLNPDSPLLKAIKPIETFLTFNTFQNKAPGPDEIRKIQIMRFPKIAFVNITKIYNYALSTGKYPESFKIGIMIFIPKPGKDPSNPKNYRPITLINIIGKAFGKIINKRFVNYLEENALHNPLQYGFRKGRGCVSSLALIYEFIARKKSGTQNYKVSVVSRDISGAFDRVWHDKLIELFYYLRLDPLFIKILSSFLRHRSIRIKIFSYTGPSFTPDGGVPQGAPESPDIFNISTLPFLNPRFLLPRPEFTPLHNTYAPWYCDDLHLIVATPCGRRNRHRHPRELRSAIISQNNFERNRGILTCPEKSVITPINRYEHERLEVNDGNSIVHYPHLARQATTKILGLHITPHSFTSRHTDEAVAKATSMLGEMMSLHGLGIKAKTLFVKSLIIPTLTYPCIPLNTASISNLYKLQKVLNKALKFTLNTYYPQIFTNRSLHQKLDIKPINQIIHNQAKSIWEKIEDGRAGDVATYNLIDDMEVTKYYNNFPSSLNISRKGEPPPIYGPSDCHLPEVLDFYNRNI